MIHSDPPICDVCKRGFSSKLGQEATGLCNECAHSEVCRLHYSLGLALTKSRMLEMIAGDALAELDEALAKDSPNRKFYEHLCKLFEETEDE